MKMSVSLKLNLPLAVAILVLMAIGTTAQVELQQGALRDMARGVSEMMDQTRDSGVAAQKDATRVKVEGMAHMLADIAPDAIAGFSLSTLMQYAETATADPEIAKVEFLDKSGNVLATVGKDVPDGLIIRKSVERDGEKFGTVAVTSSPAVLAATVAREVASSKDRMATFDTMVRAFSSRSLALAIGLSLAVAVLVVGLTMVVARMVVVRPLHEIAKVVVALAGGDLSAKANIVERNDEIGDMARAVEVFRRQGLENKELVEQQEVIRLTAERDRKAGLARVADELTQSVGSVADVLTQASTSLQGTAGDMTRLAETARARTVEVASAAEQAATNVETVAAATEELSASVAEIARSAEASRRVASDAVQRASDADHRIGELDKAVHKIGEVVQFINDIAKLTNLLALNATIEAARAGEAGKGFAVVAGEVKALANQTTKATGEIGELIAAVRGATDGAITAIGDIGDVIGEMSQISAAIASAVEQQGAATREIASSIHQASQGTDQVSNSVTAVMRVVEDTEHAAEAVVAAGDQVATQIDTLHRKVDGAVSGIRKA